MLLLQVKSASEDFFALPKDRVSTKVIRDEINNLNIIYL
jgi:hypothetical protein